MVVLGLTPSTDISIVGVTSTWHLSVNLNATRTVASVYDIASSTASQVSAALPWLQTNEWHHIAAVVSTSTACYFIDGLRIGCAPFTSITGLQPIYGDSPTFFVGGTNGMSEAGFPSGFLHGIMDEVRVQQRALPADELGYYQTDHANAFHCGHGHQVCNGECVAACLGETTLDTSTCMCSCPAGTSFDAVSLRCRPDCGGSSTPTSDGACGCDTSSYKVWRGRFLGISSPSTVPDTQHCWAGAACTTNGIGLTEVRLYDSQLERITTARCVLGAEQRHNHQHVQPAIRRQHRNLVCEHAARHASCHPRSRRNS